MLQCLSDREQQEKRQLFDNHGGSNLRLRHELAGHNEWQMNAWLCQNMRSMQTSWHCCVIWPRSLTQKETPIKLRRKSNLVQSFYMQTSSYTAWHVIQHAIYFTTILWKDSTSVNFVHAIKNIRWLGWTVTKTTHVFTPITVFIKAFVDLENDWGNNKRVVCGFSLECRERKWKVKLANMRCREIATLTEPPPPPPPPSDEIFEGECKKCGH